MGSSRPLIGREAWGRGPPAHPTGGRFQNFLQAPPEGLFMNKKFFLFVKRSLRHPARPLDRRFLLVFLFLLIFGFFILVYFLFLMVMVFDGFFILVYFWSVKNITNTHNGLLKLQIHIQV
jgi:hypothetical protein